MPDHVPHYVATPAVSQAATGAITGGRLVEVTGNMSVATAPAGSLKVLGVAARDAVSGASIPVYTDGIHDLVATGAIAAGDLLVSAAGGTVAVVAAVTTPTAADVTNTRAVIGKALEAIANGASGRVLLKI